MLRLARDSRPSSWKARPARARIFSSGQPALSRAKATSPVVPALKNRVWGFWNRDPAGCADHGAQAQGEHEPVRLAPGDAHIAGAGDGVLDAAHDDLRGTARRTRDWRS